MDPLTTNLVVADPERTTKTICLAVSPALKAYGIPGRARLFEVVRKVKEINDERKRKNGGHEFTGQSCDTGELKADRSFALDYITAVPRMALYMKYSTRIYDIYLKYVAPEQIRINAILSRCALFIFAWILNTNAEKSSSFIGSINPLSDILGSGEVVILRKC